MLDDGASACLDPPPRCVLCITGAARGSFATPLALSALRKNFVEALGCPVRILLQLKTEDSMKELSVSRMGFGVHTAPVAALKSALLLPWLASRLEEAVIVNGSGSFLGALTPSADNRPASQPIRAVVTSNSSAWRAYRARRCTLSPYLSAGNNQERMLLNHLGQSWCRAAIQRAEMRQGHPFDLVAFARPDLVWWRPVRPWCTWFGTRETGGASDEVGTTMLSCNHSGCDMAWVAPRRYAITLLSQAELHRECDGRAAACCATPEGLLQHAKRVALCQSRCRDQSARRACRASPGSALPPEVDLFADRPQIASVVRSSAACATALHSDAGTPEGKSTAQRRGVSAVTIGWLRTRFGDDVSTCERELSTEDIHR